MEQQSSESLSAEKQNELQVSPQRRWYCWHVSSVVVLLTIVGALGFGNYLGRLDVETQNIQTSALTGMVEYHCEHGWPLVYAQRTETLPEGQAMNLFAIGENQTGFWPWAMVVNVSLGLIGGIGFASLFEWRRRRRQHVFQFTLGELSLLMLVAACGVGAWVRLAEPNRVIQLIEKQHGSVVAFHHGPQWLGLMRPVTVREVRLAERGDDRIWRQIEKWKHLERIYLNNSPVTDEDLRHLLALRHLPFLELSQTKITEKGLRYVGEVQGLQRLYLQRNYVIDDKGLAHLSRLTNLKRFNLDFTQVTDKGLSHLQDMHQLTTLSLRCRKINGPGLVHLGKLKSLAELNLHNSNIPYHAYLTEQMAAQMVRALTGDPAAKASLRQRITDKSASPHWMRSELFALAAQPTLRPLVEGAIGEMLSSHTPDLRAQGVTYLPALRESADQLRQQIIPFFDDPSPLVIHAALELWNSQFSRSQTQHQPLLKLLGHPSESIRETVLHYLHNRGVPAGPLLDTLRPCLEDESRRVRFTVARYLHDNSPNSLQQVLDHVPRDEQGQWIFHDQNEQLTPLAESIAYLCVAKCSNSKNAAESQELLRALGWAVVPLMTNNIIMEKGPETGRIRNALLQLSVEQRGHGLAESLFLPDSQAWALRILGREPQETLVFATPMLVKLLDAEYSRTTALTSRRIDLMAGVLTVLSRSGSLAAPAVPLLTRMLTENKMKLNPLVVKVLGEIGPEASSTLPLLEIAAKSSDRLLSNAAQTAIYQIRQP